MYLQRIIPGHLKLDSDESHEVLKAAWQSWSAGVPKLLIVAAILVAIISGLMWLQMLITPWLGPFKVVGDIIVVGPLVLAGIFLTERGIHWFGFAACVYAELRERGHPICGKCGYDLAALPSPAPPCPECGRANPPFQTDPGGPPVAGAPEVVRGPTRPLEPPTPTGYP